MKLLGKDQNRIQNFSQELRLMLEIVLHLDSWLFRLREYLELRSVCYLNLQSIHAGKWCFPFKKFRDENIISKYGFWTFVQALYSCERVCEKKGMGTFLNDLLWTKSIVLKMKGIDLCTIKNSHAMFSKTYSIPFLYEGYKVKDFLGCPYGILNVPLK